MNANLLFDDVFDVQLPSGERRSLSLPVLLQALGRAEVESFARVQRHQADALHMFLCYLAGAVLDHEGETDATQDQAFWLAGLRRLSGRGDDDAWMLVVDDPTRPAFMQPPVVSAREFDTYKHKATTPDELDVLQTAKNHDLKGARLIGTNIEAWVLALISMQTMSGFLGQGNYGICRMNGGFASRPCIASYRDLQPARRWQEDVARLKKTIETLVQPPWLYRRNGYALLWQIPWDGTTGLGLDMLHPLFIEVCRLVRLAPDGDSLIALGKPTRSARITTSNETAGNVGDPWVPLRRKDQAAFTASSRGFHPELLRDLVIAHENYEPSAMQTLAAGAGPAWFHGSVLVRGQGTTDGYHEARIYIAPKPKALLLQGGEARDRFRELSDWALTRARDVRSKTLRPAFFVLVEGGPTQWPDTSRREAGQWADSWLARYDQRWADGYFPWLWQTIEQTDETARTEWLVALQSLALGVLDEALRSAPQRTGRRYRGRVRAVGLFHGAFRRHFAQEMTHVTE